jgi:hypothetical protein
MQNREPTDPTFDIEALLKVWPSTFGAAPIRATALLYRARTTPALAKALGTPPPSSRSLGRLLAARVGQRSWGAELVRFGGRHDNCALWRVLPVDSASTK